MSIPIHRGARRKCDARNRSETVLKSAFVVGVIAFVPLLASSGQAGTFRQLTDQRATTLGGSFAGLYTYGPATTSLDDAGSWVYVNACSNQLGGNPDHRFQIFRFDAATGAGQQITSFSKGVSTESLTVSVSDDGQWVAFVSRADPVGLNHDASPEIFVMHTDGTGIAQVTNDSSVDAAAVSAAVLSGSANRIVFRSRANPFGTNPSNRNQIFVINFDGTGLKQLTSATLSESWYGMSITDDGQRIVFASTANLTGGNSDRGSEVFAIQADGTNLRQITSSSSVWSERPVISGDGSKIAFEKGSSREIYAINWDGTGLRQLTFAIGGHESIAPSITDDGQYVFFSAYATGSGQNEIWKINTDATGLTQLTSASTAPTLDPVVAGGGGRVTFVRTVSSLYGFDGSGELAVMTETGANIRQLLTMAAWDIHHPEITRDGTRIVFESNMNPFGTNPDGGWEIFRVQADGTGLAQVTSIPSGGAFDASIAADGNTIVFDSGADIAGQNPTGHSEVFRIQADGTGVQRLTYSLGSYNPMISANGAVVVFDTDMAGPHDIGVVNADGSGQQNLTFGVNGASYSWKQHVDDTGTWVSFMSQGNLTGQSPNGRYQIYRVRTNGTGLQRVSTDATRDEYYPEMSGTGRIVYISNADPVGSNPNHYTQLFTYDPGTSQTRQVTAATGVGNAAFPAAISGDGNWVVWLASTNWDEPNPNFYLNLYRAPATGGAQERIGAEPPNGFVANLSPRPDMTATRIVFGGYDDPTEQNPDHSFDLWMVDMGKPPEIRVSPSAPTLVSWDYEAGPMRYDVIRGDVANLAPGSPGTVNLGPVVCLENDSPDADTRGFEDAGVPPVGHAFFFLFRGSRGLNYGPGTWGVSSSGATRVPGAGVCAP